MLPGRRFWHICWSEPGSRRSQRLSTGTEDEAEAQGVLAEFVAARNAPPPNPTVGWYLDERLRATAERDTGKRTASFIRKLRPHFGAYRPEQITPALVRQYVTSRGGKVAAARRELEELSAAIPEDVRPKIPLPAQRPPREKYITRDQGKQLITAAKAHHIKIFILIALTTGARAGAILDLTWDRVDMERGYIDFRNPDRQVTKKRRTVAPMPQEMRAEMQTARMMRGPSGYVIEHNGRRVESIKTGFRTAAAGAGIPWCSPHILKHSVISWLAEDGVSIDRIADLTDTDPKTVRRVYRKFAPGYLRDLTESLAAGLFDGPKKARDAG